MPGMGVGGNWAGGGGAQCWDSIKTRVRRRTKNIGLAPHILTMLIKSKGQTEQAE